MAILVTGGSGFIGGKTIARLKEKGEDVKLFERDITKTSDWEKNLWGGEVVYLIAGIRTETVADFEVNANSVDKLFEVCEVTKRVPKKIILASSQAVYVGSKIPFKEIQKTNPKTIYGKSKLEGEKNAMKRCGQLEIPLVILRYSTVLGAGVREKSRMSGPLFAWTKAAIANEPIKVFQDGQQSRDPVHIDDVVDANIMAMELPAGIYNVGGGEKIKLIDIAKWVKEAAQSGSQIEIMGGEASASDPQEMFSDTHKLKSFGWEPKRNVKQAVEEFVTQTS